MTGNKQTSMSVWSWERVLKAWFHLHRIISSIFDTCCCCYGELASIINLTLQIIICKGIGKPYDCGQLQHFNLNQQWLIFSTCLCLSRLLIMTTHFQISSKPNLAQIHNNIYSIFKMNSISTILSNYFVLSRFDKLRNCIS